MKIALFDMLHWNKENMLSLLKDHEITMFDYSIQEEKFDEDFECVCFFISSKLDVEALNRFPKLKLACPMSTGFDHINLKECHKQGVTVCNIPYYGENTIAEHAFALLLAIARKIPSATKRTCEENFSTEGLQGFDLGGKTIGIIGTGHIGMHAIKIAKGFNMTILASDLYEQKEMARKIGFKYVPLDKLLGNSDIISLHVPYNKNTHHMINKENIGKIKKGCVLINTARGAVLDTEALLWAIETNIISEAGLDVLEGEELLGKEGKSEEEKKLLEFDKRLLCMDNVLVTPHNAFNTKEALGRIEQATVDNINSFINNKQINTIKY